MGYLTQVVYTVCDKITLLFRFVSGLYEKVKSSVRTVRFNCSFKPSGRTEEKQLRKKQMIVRFAYLVRCAVKRVALGRIRCFGLSQAARDVQQLQETTNSPLRVNQISAAFYMLPHERRPGSGQPTKMMLAIKALVEWQMRDNDEATTVQLHALLLRHGYTMTVQMKTH